MKKDQLINEPQIYCISHFFKTNNNDTKSDINILEDELSSLNEIIDGRKIFKDHSYKLKHRHNYTGSTVITFESIEYSLIIYRIFQANVQYLKLAQGNDEKSYWQNINVTIAPNLDDIRWNMIDTKYNIIKGLNIFITLLIIIVSVINFLLEYWITGKAINISNVEETNINEKIHMWINNLLLLMALQLV